VGTPLTDADRLLLEQYAGPRPDPLRPPASIDELLDELLQESRGAARPVR
jgi:hypothetical protein